MLVDLLLSVKTLAFPVADLSEETLVPVVLLVGESTSLLVVVPDLSTEAEPRRLLLAETAAEPDLRSLALPL